MKILRAYEVDSKWMLLKSLPLQELLSTWMSLNTDGSSSIVFFGTVKTMQDSLLDMQLFCRQILQGTHDTVFIKTKMY